MINKINKSLNKYIYFVVTFQLVSSLNITLMAASYLKNHSPVYFPVGGEEGRMRTRVSKTIEWIFQITWDHVGLHDELHMSYRFLIDAVVCFDVS